MSEQQPPTREQIADAIEALRLEHPPWRRTPAIDAVLALFQQPTPSAEHDRHCASRTIMLPVDPPRAAACDCGAAAEPVSIADMVPGTTFTARHVDPDECGGIDHRWFVIRPGARPLVISDEGQHWSGDSVDPSTIRDVTPPPATPEEGR